MYKAQFLAMAQRKVDFQESQPEENLAQVYNGFQDPDFELAEARDRGLISDEYYQKYLHEAGLVNKGPAPPRVSELRMRRMQRAEADEDDLELLLGLEPFRGCAKAKKRPPEGRNPAFWHRRLLRIPVLC